MFIVISILIVIIIISCIIDIIIIIHIAMAIIISIIIIIHLLIDHRCCLYCINNNNIIIIIIILLSLLLSTRHRLNRYLAQRVHSLSLAGAFGSCLNCAVLKGIFSWRPRCRLTIGGFDYNVTNYHFRKTLDLWEQPLPEGWHSMVFLEIQCLFELKVGEFIVPHIYFSLDLGTH